MELRVTFRGLCLFVRRKDGKHLDVLLPETVQHQRHMPDHVHHPLLRYNGLGHSGEIRKFALRFDGLKPASGQVPGLLPNILPAGRISTKTVPPGKLGDNPGSAVASRISLPVPHKIVPGQQVWFSRTRADGTIECLELTHEVTLVYSGIEAGKLRPRIKELGNASNGTDLDEPQMSGGNVITVVVTHLPMDVNVKICPGDEVLHAHMYYEFLEGVNDPLILEEHPGVDAGCKPWTPRCGRHVFPEEFLKRDDSGTAFNCMLAQADPT